MKYVCVCRKHGVETHDGSKNPCCDVAHVMPMAEDLAVLNSKGVKLFKEDAVTLVDEIQAFNIKLPYAVDAWVNSVVKPLVESMQQEEVPPSAVETDELAEADTQGSGEGEGEGGGPVIDQMDLEARLSESYIQGIMRGFESGFTQGFEKGYDTGAQLNLLKMRVKK